jgi:hypothetical protein
MRAVLESLESQGRAVTSRPCFYRKITAPLLQVYDFINRSRLFSTPDELMNASDSESHQEI